MHFRLNLTAFPHKQPQAWTSRTQTSLPRRATRMQSTFTFYLISPKIISVLDSLFIMEACEKNKVLFKNSVLPRVSYTNGHFGVEVSLHTSTGSIFGEYRDDSFKDFIV